MNQELRPLRVSWVDWDLYEIECVCGKVHKIADGVLGFWCSCGIFWERKCR